MLLCMLCCVVCYVVTTGGVVIWVGCEAPPSWGGACVHGYLVRSAYALFQVYLICLRAYLNARPPFIAALCLLSTVNSISFQLRHSSYVLSSRRSGSTGALLVAAIHAVTSSTTGSSGDTVSALERKRRVHRERAR